MRNEERRLVGLLLAIVLLLTGQGCGPSAMDGELGPGDSAIADGPIGDGRNPEDDPNPRDEPEVTPKPDVELAPVTDMEPELVMLGSFSTLGTHLWGTAEDDIFLAAGWGLLAHFNGVRWTPFEYQGPEGFYEATWIFGFASDDVYAGLGGTTVHYDGESWDVVEALSKTYVSDLWGSGPDDIYAAAGLELMHFDGFEWREVVMDLSGVRWNQVAGSGEKHVVLIGRDSQPPYRQRFAYYNGVRWREAVAPEEPRLRDVWSAGAKDTYVVGNEGAIFHFDGETLAAMDSGTDEHLGRVHGTPDGEVFAAGGGVLLRLDGSVWKSVPTSDPDGWVSSMFAFDADSVFVAGRGVHRFDGASWGTELPYSTAIYDIWASGPENVLFAGSQTHRYDGFSVEPEDFGGLGPQELKTAWGVGDRIFATGDEGFFRYDGEHWGKLVNESDRDGGDINDLFGTSENDVIGVGADGAIVHFDGAAWQVMESGTEETLVGVWVSGPDDVYAVGSAETVLHFDGSTWSELFGSGVADYFGVTGFDAELVVAPRSDGAVDFSDGVSWRPELGVDVRAVHGTDPENLYAVGPNGLSHYDGERWTSISEFDLGTDELSIFAVGPREIYAAGARAVFRYAVR